MSAIAILDAHKHIGSYIRFTFSDGWNEPEQLTGWLHGVSQSEPHEMVWLHIDDDKTLEDGYEGTDLHGYGMSYHETFEVVNS